MSTPYPNQMHPVQNGEAVNAGVTNRPTGELAQRTDSLKEKVDHGLFGSSNIAYAQSVESDTRVGTPVYLDNDGIWKKAQMSLSSSGGVYILERSGWVCGVVSTKVSTTVADITTSGLMRITSTELGLVMNDGTPATGQLFLSSANAGKLSAVNPPVGVQVAYCSGPYADDTYTLLVGPLPRNISEMHIHYRTSLTMASTDPTVGSPTAGWVNTTTYASWFSGNDIAIPSGATWYYLHSADSQLATLWPPIPISSVELERNGIRMRKEGTGKIVEVNDDGIWYLSATFPPTSSSNPSNVAAQNYLGGYPDRIDVLFIRMVGKTQVVTSLVPADNTITITDLKGVSASTGALQISAQLPLAEADDETGYNVVKVIQNGTQKRGVVLEGIKVADGSGLVLTGGTPVNEAVSVSASGFIGGRVTIGFESSSVVHEGHFDTVAFDNVQIVDNGNGIYGYTFRQGLDSSMQGRIRVPTRNVPDLGLPLVLELVVLGKVSGQLPVLPITLYVLPQPVETCGDGNFARALPGSETSFNDLDLGDCDGDTYSISANQYVKKTTDSITVTPGSLLYFTISRDSADGYSGDLSILDLRWKLLSS